jgi:O-antigen ligase
MPIEIFETRINRTSTIYARIAAWLTAIEKGAEHPITGIGLNNLRNVLAETRTQFSGVYNLGSVHNSFLAIFVEQGIIGLVAYLAFFFSIIRKGLNLYRNETDATGQWYGIIVVAVITAHLTPALFASTLHATNAFMHIYVYTFVGAISGFYGQNRLLTIHAIPFKRRQRINGATPVRI